MESEKYDPTKVTVPVCRKCGGTPTTGHSLDCPPQAEVVASSRPIVPPCPEMWVTQDYVNGAWYGLTHRSEQDARSYAECNWFNGFHRLIRIPPEPPPAQGKENTCLSVSQNGCCAKSSATTPDAPATTTQTAKTGTETSGTVTAATSTSNPPAWATPQILAACGPGERLYLDEALIVRAYPSRRLWGQDGRKCGFLTDFHEQDSANQRGESYTIPTPPAAKCEKPARGEMIAAAIKGDTP